MILERIYAFAMPRLLGRTIKDVRIGLELLAIELDNGQVGVTYVLKNEIGHTCQTFSNAGSLIGMNAVDLAKWSVIGEDVISRSIGLAVCNSVVQIDELNIPQDISGVDAVMAVNIQPEDTIGIVGYIGPVISRLQEKKNQLLIFERDQGKGDNTYPEKSQSEFLPKCQVVFITSSTLINGTLEKLLSYCMNAREVVMVGSSTPLCPNAFKGTGVTVLSGTIWPPKNSDQIFTGVSQCAGMRQLIKHGQKVSVKVV